MEGTEQEQIGVADVGEGNNVTDHSDGQANGGRADVAALKHSVCLDGQPGLQNDHGCKANCEDGFKDKENEKCIADNVNSVINQGITNGTLAADGSTSSTDDNDIALNVSTDDITAKETIVAENANAIKSSDINKHDKSECDATVEHVESVTFSESMNSLNKHHSNSSSTDKISTIEVSEHMKSNNTATDEIVTNINCTEEKVFSLTKDNSSSEICKDNDGSAKEYNDINDKTTEAVHSEMDASVVESVASAKEDISEPSGLGVCENIGVDMIKDVDDSIDMIDNEKNESSVTDLNIKNEISTSLEKPCDAVIESTEHPAVDQPPDADIADMSSDNQVDTNTTVMDNTEIPSTVEELLDNKIDKCSAEIISVDKQSDNISTVVDNMKANSSDAEDKQADVIHISVDKQTDTISTVMDTTKPISSDGQDKHADVINTLVDKQTDTISTVTDTTKPNSSNGKDKHVIIEADSNEEFHILDDQTGTENVDDAVIELAEAADTKTADIMDVDSEPERPAVDEMEIDSSIDNISISADTSLDDVNTSDTVAVGVEQPTDVSSENDTDIIVSAEASTKDKHTHTDKSPVQESMLTKIKSKGQKLDQLLSKLKPTSVTEQDNTVNDPSANIPKIHVAKARKSCANSKAVTNVPQTLPAQISNFTFNVKELEKQGVLDVPRVQKRKAFEPFKFHVRSDEKRDTVPAKTSPVKSPVKSPSKSESPFFKKGKTKRFLSGKRKKKKRLGGYKLPGEKKTYKRKKESEERQLNENSADDGHVSAPSSNIESIQEHVTVDTTMRNASISPSSVASICESRTSPKPQNALDMLTQNSKRSFTVSSTANLKKAKKSSRTGTETANYIQTLDSFFNFPRLSSTITQSQGPSVDTHRIPAGSEKSPGTMQSVLRKRKATGGSVTDDSGTSTAVSMVSPEEKKRKTDMVTPINALSPPQPQFITLMPTVSPPMQLASGLRSFNPSSMGGTMQNLTLVPIGQPQMAPGGLLTGAIPPAQPPQPPQTIIQNGNLNGLPMFHIVNGPLTSGAQLLTVGQSQAKPLLTQTFPRPTSLVSSRVVAPGLPVILTPVIPNVGGTTALHPALFPMQTGASIMTTLTSTIATLSTAPLLTTALRQLNPVMTTSLTSPNKNLSQQRLGVLSAFAGSKLFDVTAELKKRNIVIPNGLSFTPSPPRTVDNGVSSDSGSQESVGVSGGQPMPPDKDVIPLCTCKINGASFQKLASAVTYCQALDSVDGKVMGCCNKVTNPQLVRPAVKIPFLAVCESHRKRLRLHQSCPGCGHFCTQGKFFQCRKDGSSSLHNFHEQCQVVRGGKVYCPHCGETSPQYEISLALPDNRVAPVMETKSSRIQTKAKMTVTGEKRAVSEEKDESVISHTLDKVKKTLSTNDLPFGPDRYSLERVLSSLTQERPKKYRHLPKCLYTPAYDKDLERTVYMLEDGHNANEKYADLEDQTALHAATSQGSLVIVHVLIQAGALPHVQDKNLRTPLMYATENGHADVVRYLIKAGTILDSKADDGMTALHYAAKSGHVAIIRILLDTDQLNIDITDDGGYTALIWAAEHQELDVVRLLLKRNADPNLRDSEENTSLHWAAFSGCVNVAEVLLAAGCELDSLNMHGDTPLHIAARQDHYECVVLFLARGANVELKNNKNETPVESCIDETSTVALSLKVNRQLKSFGAKHMGRPEKLLHRDLSKGRENIPIPCVNNVDDSGIPTDYLYVTDNIETQCLNVNRVIGSLQCCQCKDDCSSIYCACGKNSVKCWYDKCSRLLPEFNMLEPPLIFECNRACECWTTCNNRVVQNGVMSRLQVFRTDSRGWGCRTLIDIQRGTFICEYIGEHISDSEADRREDDSYLFDLDNRDGETYCIDARKYGNVARFINHLCDPNLVPVKVFVDSQDLRFPRICLFASKDIRAGEELGFDYGEKFWIIKWKQFTCTCGQEKCRYSVDAIQKTLEEYRQRHEDDIDAVHS